MKSKLFVAVIISILFSLSPKSTQAKAINEEFNPACPTGLIWGNTSEVGSLDITSAEVESENNGCPAHVKLNGMAYEIRQYQGYQAWLRIDTVEVTVGNLIYIDDRYLDDGEPKMVFDIPYEAIVSDGYIDRLQPDYESGHLLEIEGYETALAKVEPIRAFYEEMFDTELEESVITKTTNLCFEMTKRDPDLPTEYVLDAIELCYEQTPHPGTIGYEFFVNGFYARGSILTQNQWLFIGTTEETTTWTGGWNIEVCKDASYALLPTQEIVFLPDLISEIPEYASEHTIVLFEQFDFTTRWWGEKITKDLSPHYLGQITVNNCESTYFGFGGG